MIETGLERVGGPATLGAKFQGVRDASDETLTLVTGETFHGTAVTTYTNGQAMLESVGDHLRPDVYGPGS